MPNLHEDFTFRPLPALDGATRFPFPFPLLNPLGPLASLPGPWVGNGFNTIWRPQFALGRDHFLELNLTNESIQFDTISGQIPNRGLLQPDIAMFGITYMQQISDANLDAGLHIEPGIWAVVPPTTNPAETATVVRMASIPHGTTILAQGTATAAAGPPMIPNNNIVPFTIGDPTAVFLAEEMDLAVGTNFRSAPPQINGITQHMVDNPNSVLQNAIAGQTILSTTTLQISTIPTAPVTGGGTANTSFLAGGPSGPNAVPAFMTATFWIELVQGTPNFLQLQYSQLVMLNFGALSWPHVTVSTLRKVIPITVPPWLVDPDMPLDLLQKLRPPLPPAGAPVRVDPQMEFKPVPVPEPTPPYPPVHHPVKRTPTAGQDKEPKNIPKS